MAANVVVVQRPPREAAHATPAIMAAETSPPIMNSIQSPGLPIPVQALNTVVGTNPGKIGQSLIHCQW